MNGPGHFAESERFLLCAESAPNQESETLALAAAQAHATLALAAATVDPTGVKFISDDWTAVLG